MKTLHSLYFIVFLFHNTFGMKFLSVPIKVRVAIPQKYSHTKIISLIEYLKPTSVAILTPQEKGNLETLLNYCQGLYQQIGAITNKQLAPFQKLTLSPHEVIEFANKTHGALKTRIVEGAVNKRDNAITRTLGSIPPATVSTFLTKFSSSMNNALRIEFILLAGAVIYRVIREHFFKEGLEKDNLANSSNIEIETSKKENDETLAKRGSQNYFPSLVARL